jgi:uncharacterized protein (UPF0335 family)|tara:strand:- start:5650 stop:6417 length:768 start_codon:yes stop_codon:yes gene_type:complete
MPKTKREMLADMKTEMRQHRGDAKSGFFKMPGEWQKKYKRLKYAVDHEDDGDTFADEEGGDMSRPVKVAVPEKIKMFNTDKVTIDKSELEKLLERVEKLETEKKSKGQVFSDKWESDDDVDKKKVATIRKKMLDGKPLYAIELKFLRKQFNDKMREMELIYQVTWSGEDGELLEELPLPRFMAYDREEVSIMDEKKKKLKKVTGTTTLTKVEYDKYRSKALGKVPVQISAEEITYNVQLPSGRILKNFPAVGLNR